jgi:aryl-alcohol dehydrogenase-like predicted oxidoreductase
LEKGGSCVKKRTLGKNLEVSAIGLGCMGMSHAYGPPADKTEMIKLIHQALDLGITFFDTAEVYGPYDNEKLVGEALQAVRNDVVIATKFGVSFEHGQSGELLTDSSPQTIRRSVEGSLQRLKTDRIDLYYQHRVDKKIPVEEVAGVMSELIKEGKIAHWGMSEASADDIRRAHAVCPLTAVQSRYSMMSRQKEEDTFPTVEELGIGFVAFSPLASGLLSGQYDKHTKFESSVEKGLDYRSFLPQFKPENMDANQGLIDLINRFAKEKGATAAQISLAWMLAQKPYIVPIPGTRKPERLIENARSAEVVLSAGEVSRINEALSQLTIVGEYLGARIKS